MDTHCCWQRFCSILVWTESIITYNSILCKILQSKSNEASDVYTITISNYPVMVPIQVRCQIRPVWGDVYMSMDEILGARGVVFNAVTHYRKNAVKWIYRNHCGGLLLNTTLYTPRHYIDDWEYFQRVTPLNQGVYLVHRTFLIDSHPSPDTCTPWQIILVCTLVTGPIINKQYILHT